jgi:hypothetical protein
MRGNGPEAVSVSGGASWRLDLIRGRESGTSPLYDNAPAPQEGVKIPRHNPKRPAPARQEAGRQSPETSSRVGEVCRALLRDRPHVGLGSGRVGSGLGIRRGIGARGIVLAVLTVRAFHRARNRAAIIRRGATAQGQDRAQQHQRQIRIRFHSPIYPKMDRTRIEPCWQPCRTGKTRERVEGIEPSCVAWKATVLPLNYTRVNRRTERECCGTRAEKAIRKVGTFGLSFGRSRGPGRPRGGIVRRGCGAESEPRRRWRDSSR